MEENPAGALSKPIGAKDRRVLEGKASIHNDSGRLALHWLEFGTGFMEQEALDPVAPVAIPDR